MRKRTGQVWKITVKENQVLLPEEFWLEIFKPNKKHTPTESEINLAIYKKYGVKFPNENIKKMLQIEKLV